MKTLVATALLLGFLAPAQALDITDLRPGAYVAHASDGKLSCEWLASAAEMTFDGHNFSGHYAICRSERLKAPHRFRHTCLEAQGEHQPKLSDIDTSPDKETFESTIVVKTPKSFRYNGDLYSFCAGL